MTSIMKYVSYFNSVFTCLSMWHTVVKGQFTTISWHSYLSILFPFLPVICDVRRGKSQEKHLVKRDYFKDQVTTEVKGS